MVAGPNLPIEDAELPRQQGWEYSVEVQHPVGSPDAARVGCYGHMRIAPGKVVNGRVGLDAELPEGTSVTVLALEGDETFEVDEQTEQLLLQAIAQCENGQTTPHGRSGLGAP
jgi:hypothetical protein